MDQEVVGEHVRGDVEAVVRGRDARPSLVVLIVSSLWAPARPLASCVMSVGGAEVAGVTMVVPVLPALP